MDEPFAALDEITRRKLNTDLLELWQRTRFTAVFVTHSVFESVFLSQRIVVMSARPGRVRSELAIPAPYPRGESLRHLRRLRRPLPPRLGAALARRWRHERPFRRADPDGPLSCSPCGRASCARWRSRPTSCRGRSWSAKTLVADWGDAGPALIVTLTITLQALLAAVVVGVLLAVLFSLSRWIELSLFPYAIILQVTPIVAIAPLIIAWVDDVNVSLLICAWLVAFFPILSNTVLGLRSVDRNLLDLFELYGAGRWRDADAICACRRRLPYFLGGLRISGGLALIGAVVAEFVAGSGGRESGLAYRILESGYQLKIPRMFAALVLISAGRHRDLPAAVAWSRTCCCAAGTKAR